MNWSDERYVKLYVRKTATWITWPWQARAVFPSLLKEADGTGAVDTGTRTPEQTLAIMIGLPVDVVAVGVAAMAETGTIELTGHGYLISNYIEAQEATKTPAQKKRDQRERDRAKARVTTESHVTDGHRESPAVTDGHRLSPSSPAQPTTSPPPDHHQPSPPPPPAQGSPPRSKRKNTGQAQPDLDVTPKPTPAPKPPTRLGRVHGECAQAREGRLTEIGLTPAQYPDEEHVEWGRTGVMVAAIERRHPEKTPEQVDLFVEAIFNLWLNSDYWARTADRDGKPATPYPWNAFITEGQWRKVADEHFPVEVAA